MDGTAIPRLLACAETTNMKRTSLMYATALAAVLSPALSAQLCETARLLAPDLQPSSGYGTALAIDGQRIAIGAPQVGIGTNVVGAVYVFESSSSGWTMVERVVSPGPPNSSERFGGRVALSGDRMVVSGNPGLNSVWVLRRNQGTWSQSNTILPPGYTYATYFGESVAIAGEWIAVGMPQALGAPPVTVRTGAVHLFRDTNGATSHVATLQPSELDSVDQFGIHVAMAGDVLVVGTAMRGIGGDGRAYVYRIVNDQPVFETSLAPVGPSPGTASGSATFGNFVSTDGSSIAVADVNEAVASFRTGSVTVWRHTGGAWVLDQRLTPSSDGCAFAERIAIAGDDLVASRGCGDQVFHFRRVGGVWSERSQTPRVAGSGWYRTRGIAVAGGLAVLGSDLSPGIGAVPNNVGEARVLELGAGSWSFAPGLAGNGGYVPQLRGQGCPIFGQTYQLEVRDGVGATSGMLIFGTGGSALSVFGGVLQILPIMTSVGFATGGSPGIGGDGSALLPLSVPNAGLLGATIQAQVVLFDPAAPQGLSITNALQIVVGG
jgi:hypothetical protein